MNVNELSMNIIVVSSSANPQLCIMKSLLLLAFGVCILFVTSCSSEYSERLDTARALKVELEKAIAQQRELGVKSHTEVLAIQHEISFHAKVSGNEELFIRQLSEE